VRIAYLVDVHDRFAAVREVLGTIGGVDLLVIGGDITTGGTPDDAQRAIEGWRAIVPRLLAVAGNMDSPVIDGFASSSWASHLTSVASSSRTLGSSACRRRRFPLCVRRSSSTRASLGVVSILRSVRLLAVGC
jgi:hypothetical protein